MRFNSRMGLAGLLTTIVAFSASAQEFSDPDSFGRQVKYLGLTSARVTLDETCTPDPALPPDKFPCRVVLPQPQTTEIQETGLATMRVPAYSTRSLLCYTIQPFGNVVFSNNTATTTNGRLAFRVTVNILNDVLKGLIDPNTGMPFNGKISTQLVLYSKSMTFDPGMVLTETLSGSRACMGGLMSRSALIEGYGLTSTQASQFFARTTTIELGLSASAKLVQSASLQYGIRLYGD